MYAFTFARPATTADASQLLASGAKALAGGQTLLASMKLRQKASNFPLVGVFLAQYDSGVRVAITGAGNGVFRHKGLEEALTKSFTPQAAAAVKIEAGDLSGDLHASAAYRANLISVMAQRAVAKASA